MDLKPTEPTIGWYRASGRFRREGRATNCRPASIRRTVGDGVSNPFDVIRELALPTGAIVFRVNESFDQILGFAIDNKRWKWGLLSVLFKINA